MLKTKKSGRTIVVLFIIIFTEILLFFIKYRNQNLTLQQFNWAATGNVLNLLFLSFLIIGVIIYTSKKSITYNGRMLLTYSITILALLVLSSISAFIPQKISKIYIFEHPLNKVITGLLFFSFQFIQLIFIVFLWLKIFRSENLVLNTIVDSIIITIGLLVFAFLFSKIEQYNKRPLNKYNNSSVAVVLGAAVWSKNKPSPSLQARVEKAFDLYRKGIVSYIQLTGSNAPGELSEARAAFNFLMKKGIDSGRVWIEEKTTSTSEQIQFIKNGLVKGKNIKKIILISDPYHLARAEEICKFFRLKVYAEPSDIILSNDSKIYNGIRESVALLAFWLFGL